ncbi:MAG TPA: NADH-quinone oxidoreductase subunit N [Bacteroidota bacterium]|nr:NADH-quinone oxidoreductase subunit N [Bacteroidota bacterium]
MTLPGTDMAAIAPLLIVSVTALLLILVDALFRKAPLLPPLIALAGLAAAGIAALAGESASATAFSAMVRTGPMASYLALLFCAAGFLAVLLAYAHLRGEIPDRGELYALILFAVAGMILMASAGDLVVFFLGLELMSVSFYVLAGIARGKSVSNEAALKYFLLGAFATGFLLYGIALVYGATGTTGLVSFPERGGLQEPVILSAGLALLMVGLMFKVAAVPFHMWVPDVYEGAPTPVTALMSTGGKAAAFSGFLIVFTPAVLLAQPALREALAVVAAASMIAGNLMAVAQSGVKRMLAYSSIAHAGYMLTGIVGANATGSGGVLFYLMAYTMMNAGAFGAVSLLEKSEGGPLTFEECAGLSRRSPLVAALTALFMFSLAGVPPFAGFFGKYYVFAGAIEGGMAWLAVTGVVMSVVSAYYYLRLVVLMYFSEQAGAAPSALRPLGIAALVIAAAAVICFGAFPSTLLALTSRCFPPLP